MVALLVSGFWLMVAGHWDNQIQLGWIYCRGQSFLAASIGIQASDQPLHRFGMPAAL
jgi:hypothetical protein